MPPKRASSSNGRRPPTKKVKTDDVPPELRALGVRSMDQDELNIRNQKLETLPASMSKLKKLKILEVHNTGLKIVPEWIANLKNLISLTVSMNSLTSLPESIGKLKNLTMLDVSYNYLKSLPKSIDNLDLMYVYAGGNDLRSLPKFKKSRLLMKLNIENNPRLTNIPVELERVNNLRKNNRVSFFKLVNKYGQLKYENFKLPNNGAMDAITYKNFKKGDKALRIKNANRTPTYMSVNTFNRLSTTSSQLAARHIYKTWPHRVKNIGDVYSLPGNMNIFINPMTTKMVKRNNIEFVKFV